MADPARNIYDDEESQEGFYSRDKLRAIEGGGEGGGKPAGNLRSVPESGSGESGSSDSSTGDESGKREGLSGDKLKDIESGKGGGLYQPAKTRRQRFKNARANWKKYAIGGGVGASIVGLILSAFFALFPLKLQFIMQNIDRVAGEVPQAAVEARAEYLVRRYIIRTTAKGLNDVEVNRFDARYKNTFFGSMISAWDDGRVLNRIERESGIQFVKSDRNILQPNSTSFEVIDPRISDTPITIDGGGNPTLAQRQMRTVIKEAVEESTQKRNIIKRAHMRRVLRDKYGVRRWEIPWLSEKHDSYRARKSAAYRWFARNTLGRFNNRLGNYITCISSSDDCKNLNTKSDGDIDAPDGDEDIDRELPDGDVPDGSDSDLDSNRLIKRLTSRTVAKALGFFGAGLTILEFNDLIVDAVDYGIPSVQHAKNLESYVSSYTHMKMCSDQITGGTDTVGDSAANCFEMFENFESDPLYQYEFGNLGANNVAVAAGQVQRDCDKDGDKELLPPNELICEEHWFSSQRSDFPGLEIMRKTNDSFLGSISRAISDLLNSLVSAVGIDQLAEGLFNIAKNAPGVGSAIEGAQGLIEDAISKVLGPPACTGVETGETGIYSCMRGGAEGTHLELARDPEHGLGGYYLNDEQVAAIREESRLNNIARMKNQSISERYFSLDNPDSLIAKLIISTPTPNQGIRQNLASITKFPAKIVSTLSNIPFNSLFAQNAAINNDNPFHAAFIGYAPNDEVLSMDPVELENKYGCSQYDEEDYEEYYDSWGPVPEEGIYYDVPKAKAPCALEKLTTNALSSMFTSADDGGIGSGTTSDTTDSSSLPSGTAQDLAQQILDDPSISLQAEEQKIIEDIAAGVNVSKVHVELLRVIVALGENHTFTISELWRHPNAQYGAANSRHKSGLAMDVSGRVGVDGSGTINYGTQDERVLNFFRDAIRLMPSDCEAGLPTSSWVAELREEFGDKCDYFYDEGTDPHLHIALPRSVL